MITLINMLDRHLSNCRKHADSQSLRRTYFDQAFGMVLMYCALFPNNCQKAEQLWDDVYRSQFEEILWG